MSNTRRTINLVIALAMMIAGWGYLGYLLFFTVKIPVLLIAGAETVGGLGTTWIYEDYINAKPNG